MKKGTYPFYVRSCRGFALAQGEAGQGSHTQKMPRRARIVVPQVPVHLIQRGHNRRACFLNEGDFEYYLHWLDYFSAKFECQIHSYVLMDNHIHLAITPSEHDGLAHLMKSLNQRFVAYMNKSHQRSGTLWEGRFKSCLILDRDYLLTCMRYIELNPVRAGIVEHPRDYPWSSYRANAEGREDCRITPHAHYIELGSTEHERRLAYRDMVAGTTDDIATNLLRCATNANLVVGDTSTINELSKALEHRLPPGQRGRPKKRSG